MAAMLTALAVLLAIVGAGLLGTYPLASLPLFVGAWYTAGAASYDDQQYFAGAVFVLAAVGFAAGFFFY